MAKVLLVDANQDSQAALSKALVEAGYEVVVASSGSFALGALEWERPDLVVSHAQVQDMDGYELFTRVRQDPTTTDTPFLLLAGRDRPIALAAAEAGAEMTVTGDFTIEMVVGGVMDLLKPEAGAREPRSASPVEASAARRSMGSLWAALEASGPRSMAAGIDAAFQGSLDVMDLAEVTQAIALGGKTGALVVSMTAGDGDILFENGRVIHAAFRGRTGEQAFAAIVSSSQRHPDGHFRFSLADRAELARAPKTISRSVEQLLLSIAVGIDESETGGGPLENATPAHRRDG